MTTQPWAIILVLIGTFIGSIGPIFFKKGADKFNFNPLQLIKNYNLIAGLFFYGISLIIFVIALTGGEVSILYPIVSVSYIWVCFLSIKILKEKMNLYKWLGILFIIFGVSMIGIAG
ncbi:EamA family transporter [Candidatus Woesearchaeota archaeon]|nr:EamA family transporter [Candidatus Woesearchaeota archaeon]